MFGVGERADFLDKGTVPDAADEADAAVGGEGLPFAGTGLLVAPGVDAAISYAAGPGGLRTDVPAGPATLGALYDVFPFDNLGLRRTLTGAPPPTSSATAQTCSCAPTRTRSPTRSEQ